MEKKATHEMAPGHPGGLVWPRKITSFRGMASYMLPLRLKRGNLLERGDLCDLSRSADIFGR